MCRLPPLAPASRGSCARTANYPSEDLAVRQTTAAADPLPPYRYLPWTAPAPPPPSRDSSPTSRGSRTSRSPGLPLRFPAAIATPYARGCRSHAVMPLPARARLTTPAEDAAARQITAAEDPLPPADGHRLAAQCWCEGGCGQAWEWRRSRLLVRVRA
jgi:hypothetical protein